MRRYVSLRKLKLISDTAIKKGNIGVGVLLVIYTYCMLIHPWFAGGFSWKYVHSVWYTWQALNVGILAFASSLLAFNIAKFNAEKQRQREFIAERAMLPQALSDLCKYLKECTPIITEAYNRSTRDEDDPAISLESKLPNLATSHISVFQNCIKVAEPDVGQYLAEILGDLQVHSARLDSMQKSFSSTESIAYVHNSSTYVSYLYCLAEIQAKINKLFDFARGEAQFDNSKLTLNEMSTAYSVLDIHSEDYDGLDVQTENALKANSTDT